MNLILKHTIRSARANIIQIAVIIVAVIISTVMIFASFSMSDVFYNINMTEYDRTAQGADMLIGGNGGGATQFSRARVEELLDSRSEEVARAEYFLKLTTVMRTDTFSKAVQVEATDLNDYLDYHKLNYIEKFEGLTVEYKAAIISEAMSKETGLKAGDTVEIYLAAYGVYTKVTVMYVSANEGLFAAETTPNILVDFSAIGNKGQVSAVYVTFTDVVTDVAKAIESYDVALDKDLPYINVGEGNSVSQVKTIVRQNTLLFAVGLVFIVATMMLILLTSYQIIARHRMKEMTVFKAAGATPAQTAWILLTEVVLYGAVGTVFGLLIGRLTMQIAVNSLLPFAPKAISYQPWKYVVTAILTLTVTVLASLGPVISASKKTIRELEAGTERTTAGRSRLIPFIVSAVLIIAVAVTMSFLTDIWLLVGAGVLLLLLVVWIYSSTGYIVRFVSFIYKKIFKSGSANLAATVLPRSKAMHTVTVLIAVLIAFSFMVVQVVGLVKTAVEPFRGRYEAEIVAVVAEKNKDVTYSQVASDILHQKGVESCGFFSSHTFTLTEDDDWSVYGVSDYETLKNCSAGGLSDGTEEAWLTTVNPIVLSEEVYLRMGWKIGDSVTLTSASEDYEDKPITFTVVGIDYTTSEYDRIAYCRYDTLAAVSPVGVTYLINTEDDSQAPFLSVREYFDNSVYTKCYVLPFEEWAYAGQMGLSGVSTLLSIIQIAIYVISVLGVFNIAVVTVYDRRKEIALYRLCGMSQGDYIKFTVAEATSAGLAGAIAGLISSVVLNRVIPVMANLIGRYVNFGVFPSSAAIAAVIGIALFTLVWLAVAFLNRNNAKPAINERFY